MWWAELRDRVTPSQAMPLWMGCCPLVSEAGRQVTGFSDNSDMASVQLGAAGDRPGVELSSTESKVCRGERPQGQAGDRLPTMRV